MNEEVVDTLGTEDDSDITAPREQVTEVVVETKGEEGTDEPETDSDDEEEADES
jgi:hypothetical protein